MDLLQLWPLIFLNLNVNLGQNLFIIFNLTELFLGQKAHIFFKDLLISWTHFLQFQNFTFQQPNIHVLGFQFFCRYTE